MKYFSSGKHGRASSRARSFAVALPLLLLVACTGPSINEEPNTVAQERTAESATVDEVLSDPNAFYGLRATVTGRVTEVISPLAFELNGNINEDTASGRYGEGADGLLVVKDTEQAPKPEVAVGQRVQVTGTVRSFSLTEIEEEIDDELIASLFTYWASQPSMVAGSIEPTGEDTMP